VVDKNKTYNMDYLNSLSYEIIGAAYQVHSELGPGLLESTYEVCLEYELIKRGFKVERQKALPVIYDDKKLDAGYRIDLLVEDSIIVELKSVAAIEPIHKAQIMTYLKLSELSLGLLLNFNVTDMKKGINRFVM
jgi:GxxExxY protein